MSNSGLEPLTFLIKCPRSDSSRTSASTCAAAEKPLQREQPDDLDGPVVFVLQARDLAFLLNNASDSVQSAHFQLDYVQACDMFPQTRCDAAAAGWLALLFINHHQMFGLLLRGSLASSHA
jgi:hypothetical protein